MESDSLNTTTCLACGAAEIEPWAEAVDLEYFTSDDRYAYLRCAGCGSLSISPVPADQLGTIYPSDYYSYDSGYRRSFVQRVKAFFDRRFLRAATAQVPGDALAALDVGGGVGQQLDALQDADDRVSRTAVVDLDEGAQRVAEAAGHEFHCMPVEAYRSDKRFDVILMLNLIEHVADPEAVLRAAHELLSDSGVIVIKTPNVDSFDARLFRHGNWGGYHCPRHWVLFTRDSFTRCAARAGLDVARFSYEQGAPFWATSSLFALHRRGLIRLSSEVPVFRHWLFPVAILLAAAIDIPRSLFFKTSQMVFVLRRQG